MELGPPWNPLGVGTNGCTTHPVPFHLSITLPQKTSLVGSGCGARDGPTAIHEFGAGHDTPVSSAFCVPAGLVGEASDHDPFQRSANSLPDATTPGSPLVRPTAIQNAAEVHETLSSSVM